MSDELPKPETPRKPRAVRKRNKSWRDTALLNREHTVAPVFTGRGEGYELSMRERVGTFDGLTEVILDWVRNCHRESGRAVNYRVFYKRWAAQLWAWYGVRMHGFVEAMIKLDRIVRIEDYETGRYVLWDRTAWDALSPADRTGPVSVGRASIGSNTPKHAAVASPIDEAAQALDAVNPIDSFANPVPDSAELGAPFDP